MEKSSHKRFAETYLRGTIRGALRTHGLIMNETDKKLFNDYVRGKSLHIERHIFDDETFKSLDNLLLRILAHHDLIYIIDSMETIIRELITNAYKANLKRVYFLDKDLDINDAVAYKQGVESFKDEAFDEAEHYHELLEEKDLRISLTIDKQDKGLRVEVANNIPASSEELHRIENRMQNFDDCDGFLDSYNQFYDKTEGAGLGIHMVYFLLKNSGIDPEVFSITSENGYTRSVFTIPYQLRPVEISNQIKEEILNEVELLPTLPAHITDLIRLCHNPEFSVKEVSNRIMTDPSLTADVLKLANSAAMASLRHVDTIPEAVVQIGVGHLEELLMTAGAQKILSKRYTSFETIWHHCQKTAHFAAFLANRFGKKAIESNVYLSGLLHDIGKIILLSIGKNMTHYIAEILSDRAIKVTTLVEEISIGISHATIGSLMAKHWLFPDYLVEIIRVHHSPLSVPESMKDQTYITYLANMFCGMVEGRYLYSSLEEEVLCRFSLDDEDKVMACIDQCEEQYEKLK